MMPNLKRGDRTRGSPPPPHPPTSSTTTTLAILASSRSKAWVEGDKGGGASACVVFLCFRGVRQGGGPCASDTHARDTAEPPPPGRHPGPNHTLVPTHHTPIAAHLYLHNRRELRASGGTATQPASANYHDVPRGPCELSGGLGQAGAPLHGPPRSVLCPAGGRVVVMQHRLALYTAHTHTPVHTHAHAHTHGAGPATCSTGDALAGHTHTHTPTHPAHSTHTSTYARKCCRSAASPWRSLGAAARRLSARTTGSGGRFFFALVVRAR